MRVWPLFAPSVLLRRCRIVEPPFLEKCKFDFNSDVSLEEQREQGMILLRKHCQDFIDATKVSRDGRVEDVREAHLA